MNRAIKLAKSKYSLWNGDKDSIFAPIKHTDERHDSGLKLEEVNKLSKEFYRRWHK